MTRAAQSAEERRGTEEERESGTDGRAGGRRAWLAEGQAAWLGSDLGVRCAGCKMHPAGRAALVCPCPAASLLPWVTEKSPLRLH